MSNKIEDVEKTLLKMKQIAETENIPIVMDDGLEILLSLVNKHKPKNILEIGTAIGYSAMQMNKISDAEIITFERDQKMLEQAKQNIPLSKNPQKIKLIEEDFLNFAKLHEFSLFDFIYIDGAKAQYYNFFNHAKDHLTDDGIIVFDNLKFHGYVNNPELTKTTSRNLRQLIRKIESFLEKIKSEPGYTFDYIDSGDGIGILKKGENE